MLLAIMLLWSAGDGWFRRAIATADQPDGGVDFDIRLLAIDANEGIAAGDVDGDGVADLVAGRSWYQGGSWAPRPVRSIDDWNGYVQSNGDFLFDVNGDGRLDVVAGSYLPTKVKWFENPGGESLRLGKLWPPHVWFESNQSKNEGQLMQDLDGDGVAEWIVNSWDKNSPMMVWRMTSSDEVEDTLSKKSSPKMVSHQVGVHNGHGLAIGDISGDGKPDILFGQGWYEQPADDPWSSAWTVHLDWELDASIPMLVVDVDMDGDNDLIHGAGHDYGLSYWENESVQDGKIQWREHLIDDSYSQVHSMAWADVDGDGQQDLIAGKRYYAHNGKDPGGNEMPCLYYYTREIEPGAAVTFIRHVIDEGHVGCGLQIVAEDLDGDTDVDIAVAGKSGTYVLTNRTR